ncbi:hypothetical protein SAMN04487843_11530 [Methylobacterium sp. ap11]|jgi:hypothetical protein|uniref:hypothetical protein n=1 Tax=Methylobacterium sp. ap11 TaxID=1761799 RepID=UPI0008C7EED0|nr:hypothetical protein [Methylobacterium sp. ap11]SEP39611.1 hypothetical protein SAMN04487843_11530 [Methylobacterium sp. ap11]
MTGGEAYKQKLLGEDALDAAVAAYLSDPSKPVVVEVGTGRIDVAAAVLAHAYAVEVLGREGVTGPQRRNAVRTATPSCRTTSMASRGRFEPVSRCAPLGSI